MMQEARLMNILRAPVVSEKSTLVRENTNTIVFKVLPNATKKEIKVAVETILGVKVDAVRTLNVQGKARRTNRGIGRRSNWKKAYVTLAAGQNLDDMATAEKETN
ncbi:50S ribosomal protein L23 [Anaerobiospirillum thomasii]|uniref:Large ribosomal subunit protein uL23 n=1 Tax=Anaerobiospirillum thomasii TaxID=179995 RepID=A0A2X0X004_9GAMM|nr:50S ribosomal protein L23 [Anaerobiospirillum thomasii]SPT69283.1 50S ribosomal protein L23 [Anaerobiospirillum thomasii]SPT72152.1 50S ribosomal protein L23 [Anaerobiospirillum thomasii]